MIPAATLVEIFAKDCLLGMADLAVASVDVVVTSPPYNLGVAYRTYRDRLDREEYFRWCAKWLTMIHGVLKDKGSLFLNLGDSSSDPLLAHEIVILANRGGFRLQNTIHWIKAISIEQPHGEIVSRGHFTPINSKRHLNACHEYVFHLTKTGDVEIDRKAVGVPYADKSNIARWSHTGGADRRCRGNVWFVPYRTIRSRQLERPHPATFPVELAEKCLRLHGVVKPVVMDPFLGLGGTAEAALRVGAARFIGYDVDDAYVAFAKSRVKEWQNAAIV